MKISVIVLNYKGAQNTIDCVNSIKDSVIEGYELEVIVVENGSNDGSREKLKNLKNIKLLISKSNLGYTGGNNLGIKEAIKNNADFILIINNDTIIDKDAISHFVRASNKAQIVSPKIYFAHGFEFHKDRYKKNELGKVIWYVGGKIDWENIIGSHVGVDEVDRGQYDTQREIDFATGACLFIKKEVFEKIGLFNEKYFLYLEDMDFSVRAKNAGIIIIFEPRAVVWHKNAQSAGGSGSKLQDYYISRNRLLFAFKYAKPKTKIAVLKQIITQSTNSARRGALIDFLTFNFGKSERNFN